MNTIQRTSSAGEPMIGDARKSLQAGITSMSPHYVVMEGPRRKVSLFHVSHVLGRKKQNLTKPHNTKKKFPYKFPVCLLACWSSFVMSYWHRFCSLHERGRSRQLIVRKSCSCNFFSWRSRDAQQGGPSTSRRKSPSQHSGDLMRRSIALSSFCPPAADDLN